MQLYSEQQIMVLSGLHKVDPGIVSQIFYTLAGFPIISIGTLTKYSADGGVSWNLSEFPTEPIYSLTEMEDNKCLGVGGNGYIVYAIFNQDSGVHFTQEPSPTTQNLYSVHYPKLSNFIWAVGANGTILKTTLNWTRVSLVPLPYCSFNSVYFTDSNTGYGVSCGIFKTTDSGITWTQQTWGGSATLRSVYFTDASTGYIVGASGTILKTTNSGTNWTPCSGTTQSLNSVYFTDANTGYIAAGNGQILKTTNGGTDWTSQYYPYYDFYSIYFSDANTGYIAGEYGGILKTIQLLVLQSVMSFFELLSNISVLNRVAIVAATLAGFPLTAVHQPVLSMEQIILIHS